MKGFSWLNYRGRFTHVSCHPSFAGRAQEGKVRQLKRPIFYNYATQPASAIAETTPVLRSLMVCNI